MPEDQLTMQDLWEMEWDAAYEDALKLQETLKVVIPKLREHAPDVRKVDKGLKAWLEETDGPRLELPGANAGCARTKKGDSTCQKRT
jgi:hypothetical protein